MGARPAGRLGPLIAAVVLVPWLLLWGLPLPWGCRAGRAGRLDRLDLRRGTLLIFDRRTQAPPLPERVSVGAEHSATGRLITIVRLCRPDPSGG